METRKRKKVKRSKKIIWKEGKWLISDDRKWNVKREKNEKFEDYSCLSSFLLSSFNCIFLSMITCLNYFHNHPFNWIKSTYIFSSILSSFSWSFFIWANFFSFSICLVVHSLKYSIIYRKNIEFKLIITNKIVSTPVLTYFAPKRWGKEHITYKNTEINAGVYILPIRRTW